MKTQMERGDPKDVTEECWENADVSFEVRGEKLYAHKCILSANAPVLASLCEGTNQDTPIKMNEITSVFIQCVLHYAYGEVLPELSVMLKMGKELRVHR